MGKKSNFLNWYIHKLDHIISIFLMTYNKIIVYIKLFTHLLNSHFYLWAIRGDRPNPLAHKNLHILHLKKYKKIDLGILHLDTFHARYNYNLHKENIAILVLFFSLYVHLLKNQLT